MNEKKLVLQGVLWKFAERIAAQLVSVIVSIILARLLTPDEYGMISIVTVFINIANIFATSGFGSALIQKKNADSKDYSSVFYFTLGFTAILYIILFFLAIPISNFYNMPLLKNVIRVLGLTIPITGVNSIQHAYISRKMEFKKYFKATFIGTVISAIIGIVMAYLSFGVWALVVQSLTNSIIDTIVLQASINWKITKEFSFDRIRILFDYGWKLLAQSFIVQVYSSLRSLLIGKIYTASDLAYYTKGNQFPDLIAMNIESAINTVLFPAMSRAQDSLATVKNMARKTTQITSYIMSPLIVGFIVVANSFICVLLTDKWLMAVPYLRIECIILLFRTPQTAILQALKAIGKSDSVLKCDIPIRVFAFVVLLVSIKFGVLYFAISEILTTLFGMLLYAFEAKKHIGYSYIELISDFLLNVFRALIMGGIVWGVGLIMPFGSLTIMMLQIVLGVSIYLIISILGCSPDFYYVLNTVKEFLITRREVE